jgi:Ni/Fe-hydrogenase subunit HybB-like protein
MVLLAVLATLFGLLFDPRRTWLNLLLNGFYFLGLSTSALFFLATQRLSGARWSASLRRIPEAMMSAMPVGALLMLSLFFGRQWIYPWSRPGAFLRTPVVAGKVQYLSVSFVFERMAIVLFLWVLFAWLFRRTSLQQDDDPSMIHHQRLNRYAAIFVVVFALSFTVGSFDWLISLEPDWFSTIYAIYVFAGCFVQGLSAVTLAAIVLRGRSQHDGLVSIEQLHDLGKLIFAFSTFWAYIWLCQYLLIWYGNLPDEVTYYIKRTSGAWLYLFALNFVMNWVIPFVALLSQRAKRTPRVLKVICALLLCGHWLDLYLLIMPSALKTPKIGMFEILVATGYAALFTIVFLCSLAEAPLVPVNDPLLSAHRDAGSDDEEFALHSLPGAQQ